MDFADWLALFRRYWVILTAATLLGVVLGLGAATLQARTWTSTTMLLLSPAVKATGGQDLAYSGQYVATRMKTYTRLAASSSVRATAVAALPDGNAGIGSVEASWEPETTVLRIDVTSSSAEDAQADAALVVDAFNQGLAELEGDAGRPVVVEADVISEPTLPADPTTPKVAVNLLGGALLGLLAGLAVALVHRLRRS